MKITLVKLSLFFFYILQAQSKPIRGYVFNQLGEPLSNVNVTATPSEIGTQTGQDGMFYLLVPINDRQLFFEYIGYKSLKKNIILFKNDSKIILKEVVIKMDSLFLEEDKLKKFDLEKVKNNVVYIKSENLNNRGAADIADGIYFDQSVILNESINGRKTLSIRGSTSNELSLFYDGIRINRIGNPMVDLSVFPTSGLTGLEILKGSHESAISSSGSINLIPNIKYTNNVSFGQQFGTYNYGGYNGAGSFAFKNISFNYGISESNQSQSYTDTTILEITSNIQRDFLNIGYKNNNNLNLKFLTYNHRKQFNNYRNKSSINFNSKAYILKLAQYSVLKSNIFIYGMYQNQEGQENLNLFYRGKVSDNRELGFEIFKKIKNADLKIISQTSLLNFQWNLFEGNVVTKRQSSVLTGSFELNKPEQEGKLILKDFKLVLSNHRITDETDTSMIMQIPYEYWENNNFNFTISFLKKVLKKRTYYYLNFASTYRFPSLYEITNNYTNDLLNISANLKPEQKSAFELGYKSKRNPKVGESSYDLNTSFFYYSYLNKMKNIIISAAASQFIVNSDKAEIFGFDSELTLIPSVNWISFKILFSNYFYSDASFFPMQPNRVFKNIISFKTRLIKVDIINRNEGEKIVSSLKEDGSIIENKLDPALGFDCNISKNFNYKFLKFSVSMNGKNLLSEKTSINGISIYDKRYYLKINVKV